MSRAGYAIALGAVAVLTGSCTAIPRSPPARIAARPAPPPTPPLAPPPAEDKRPASGFRYGGAITQGALLLAVAPAGTIALTLDGDNLPFAADGHFLVGFGREAKPTAVLEAQLAGGARVRELLSVAPRHWDIQSLPTLPKGTAPTPDFVRRRAVEIARINAARAGDHATDGWRQRFRWPVTGRISGVFGSQRIYAGEPGSPHSGVDVAGAEGTPIVAPADGVVVLAAASPFTLEGNLLMLDHGMGLGSAFLHLSRIDVKVGDRVVQGQPLGAIGKTGRATGPHLHWAMKWRAERIDPELVAGPMPGH